MDQNELLKCTIAQQSVLDQTRQKKKKFVNEIGLNECNIILSCDVKDK